MTIQRQYNLPNCTLLLEGVGDSTASQSEFRPLMSMLVNVECHIVGQEQPLSGGRVFFESFVTAVSLYAQEVLSGIHAFTTAADQRLVQLQRLEPNRHRLTVYPEGADPGSGIAAQLTREFDLTTVQLFDVVEAVDQFFADSQTLPDLGLKLAPISKRYVKRAEPMIKRAIPAAIGASSVALAAIACFSLPVPSVRQPSDLIQKPGTPTTGASPTATPSLPIAEKPPSPAASSPTASPTTVAQPDLTKLESVFTTAPAITDPAQIDALSKPLYTQIDQAWKTRTPFVEDLIYRVGVSKDGKILGYKPVNPAALTNAKQTPLLDLLKVSAGNQATSDPIAQFKVIFTATGGLEVTPWQGMAASPSKLPINAVAEITNSEQIKELQPKLYEQIDKAWTETPKFKEALIYRVRVNKSGAIADYKPETKAATDYAREIPLPKLGKQAADNDQPSEPLALFKVVFKPDGKLEVSPWRGRKD